MATGIIGFWGVTGRGLPRFGKMLCLQFLNYSLLYSGDGGNTFL